MYNYDDLINYVGLSSYQIVIMICSSLMIWPSGLNNVAPMFLMETPPFHAQQAWLDQRVEFQMSINHHWWKFFVVFDPEQEFDPNKVKIQMCRLGSKVIDCELKLKRTTFTTPTQTRPCIPGGLCTLVSNCDSLMFKN